MDEKNVGFALLGVGIMIMLGAFLAVLLMFTSIIEPIKFFDIKAPSFNTSSLMPSIPGLPKSTGENIELIPTTAFNKMLNVSVFFIFMTFVMSFGFKISDLGVKLIRPIKIEARSQ